MTEPGNTVSSDGTPQEGFEQSDAIRDHVFPLFDSADATTASSARFIGTGFFFGHHSHALTAAHVMRGVSRAVALLAGPGRWIPFAVLASELHPREDVAVLTVEESAPGKQWSSFFTLRERNTRSSLPYHLWGYPEDAAIELLAEGAGIRPDLVYSEGHVRRQITDVPLPSIRGSRFIELSSVAGAGCSGGSVLRRIPGDKWDLCGVYVGERVNDRATSVGYAAILDELGDWTPTLIGRSLAEEANDLDPRW